MTHCTKHLDFPFQNCLLQAGDISVSRVCQQLTYHHGLHYTLLDLQGLLKEVQAIGEEKVITRYLSAEEQVYWARITSPKRKRDWLAGRFGARYVAAEVLAQDKAALHWSDLHVLADENGRPFLSAAGKTGAALPDISISHSGDLAAVLAVGKGLCGIDIQKVTDQVIKVQERFCTPGEAKILHSCFDQATAALALLWAAKESLRKVANSRALPGFLELELQEITCHRAGQNTELWKLIFVWKRSPGDGTMEYERCLVIASFIADNALAFTIRNATVG